MSVKLTWDEIKQRYDGEWVVLVEQEWDTHIPVPDAGVVKYHCKTKQERNHFLQLHRDELTDVALVFVGEPEAQPQGHFISANHVCLQ